MSSVRFIRAEGRVAQMGREFYSVCRGGGGLVSLLTVNVDTNSWAMNCPFDCDADLFIQFKI